MKFFFLLSILIGCHSLFFAQKTGKDSLDIRTKKSLLILNKHSILLNLKLPQHQQGFICNFEDELNRKKIPLNFSLGNSKY